MAKKNPTKSSAGTTDNPAPPPAPVLDVRDLPPPEAVETPKAQAAGKKPVGAPSRQAMEEAASDEPSAEEKTSELIAAFLEGDEAPKAEEDSAEASASETSAEGDETAGQIEPAGEETAEEEPSIQNEVEESQDAVPEPTEEDDEALEALAAVKKWPKSYVRKLKRERAKRAALEARIADLEEQQSRPASQATESTAGTGFTQGERQAQAKADRLRAAISWLSKNAEGATIKDEKGIERELSAEEVQQWKDTYSEQLDDVRFELRALKRERDAESENAKGILRERHPWMAEAGNERRGKVEAFIARYPAFDNGIGRILVADGIAYQELLERAAKAASSKGQTNGKPAPPPPAQRNGSRGPSRPAAAPVASVPRNQIARDYLDNKPGATARLVASLLER